MPGIKKQTGRMSHHQLRVRSLSDCRHDMTSSSIAEAASESSQRPLEILEDVRSTEQRRRVSSALECRRFCCDLEALLVTRQDYSDANSSAVDQTFPRPYMEINDITRSTAGQLPINDMRGPDSVGVSPDEKRLRCRVTSLCRLINLHGWASGIHNHITVRVNSSDEHFLVNPFGVMYYELTASSLLKVDAKGDVLSHIQNQYQRSSIFTYNQATFNLHLGLHRVRPDVKCIVHLHTAEACAVSSLKHGLLPICHEALLLGGISYHEYTGLSSEDTAKNLLCKSLGPFNKVLILRNHGIAICGTSVEDAWTLVSNAMKACHIQCCAMSAVAGNLNMLTMPTEEIQDQMVLLTRIESTNVSGGERRWRTGELEFEASMRLLDNCGMRTGHDYRFPYALCANACPGQYDITIPPSQTSSLGPSDRSSRARNHSSLGGRRSKAEWLFSPNSYTKQEDKNDSSVPLSCTKWSASSGLTSSTPVTTKHAFAPSGGNFEELMNIQKMMKERRIKGQVNAGPMTEICRNIEQYKASIGQLDCPDKTVIIGAASRAIVKREEQHNPSVYASPYVQNPFVTMQTQADIDASTMTIVDSTFVMETTSSSFPDGINQISEQYLTPESGEENRDSIEKRTPTPEVLKERKKSSFRTPSFLKRRKRETVSVDKSL